MLRLRNLIAIGVAKLVALISSVQDVHFETNDQGLVRISYTSSLGGSQQTGWFNPSDAVKMLKGLEM